MQLPGPFPLYRQARQQLHLTKNLSPVLQGSRILCFLFVFIFSVIPHFQLLFPHLLPSVPISPQTTLSSSTCRYSSRPSSLSGQQPRETTLRGLQFRANLGDILGGNSPAWLSQDTPPSVKQEGGAALVSANPAHVNQAQHSHG